MMMFQDNMFVTKNGEEPKLMFGGAIDSTKIKFICERLNNNPKGKHLNREPIYEYIINKGQQLRLYFDYDGEDNSNYDDLSPIEFEELCKTRNQYNINKLMDYFKDITLDISVSSYNGFDMSNVNGNKHFGKRKLSFHYIISNVKGTIEQNKLLASEFGWDTSIYPAMGKKQLFRIGKQHKHPKCKREKNHRKPKLESNSKDISKHIIQYVPDECKALAGIEFKQKNIEINIDCESESTDIDNYSDNESIDSVDGVDRAICPILKGLPTNYVNNYKDWLKITYHYKQFGSYENWCNWCKTSTRYDPIWDIQNKKIWDERPLYKGDGKKAIHLLVNPLDEERQLKLFKLLAYQLNDSDIVDDIISQFKSYFKVVNYKKDDIFVYNRDTDLWEAVTKDYLNCYLSKYWLPHLAKLDYIVSSEVVEADGTDIKSKFFGKLELTAYEKAKAKFQCNINTQGNTKTKNNYIKEFFLRDDIKDEKFKQKLNKDKHILSVKGGKVNLKTKEFSYRTQEDYISYELDIEYNKNAKNIGFEDFIKDILTPVINDNGDGKISTDYLQRYLGYSITGETKQEKILVLMGNGSNGKSKLFSILQNVLKANVDMVGTWNADLFNENTGSSNVNNASPEIAKLYGKRLGFINESKKSMVWGETFKKLVDTGSSLTARELYGASFEFDLSTSFIMCSNEFPNFPIQNCFIRRIDTLELMNRYCDMNNRNASEITPNDKPININIINEICGNLEHRQGILNWLIEGAFDYYKEDKLLNIPSSQEKKKEIYISGNDWFSNFTITKEKKDYIEVNTVYETINLLTSCRVKRDEMIEKFKESGGVLARKMIGGKKVPIIRFVKDSIEDIKPDWEGLEEVTNHNLNNNVNPDE